MGNFARIELKGFDQLRSKLEKLDTGLKDQALRSAGYAGAKVIQDEAILNAPYMTGPTWMGHPPPGTLKNSIIVKRIAEQCGPYKQVYYITVRRGKVGSINDGYYAGWVEYGHIYRPAGMKLKGGASGKAAARATHIATGGVTVPAYPYMRPAFISRREEAQEKIVERLGSFITFAMA